MGCKLSKVISPEKLQRCNTSDVSSMTNDEASSCDLDEHESSIEMDQAEDPCPSVDVSECDDAVIVDDDTETILGMKKWK